MPTGKISSAVKANGGIGSTAAGDLVYNCRCTAVAAVEGADAADAKRRASDPKTGESVLIENMSFAQ